MYSRVYSGVIRGVSMEIVRVEADVSDGLPCFEMVGLLNSEVKESRERVRTAIKNSGFVIPPKRVTLNLSPAGIKKEGSGFDLPIAIGIMESLGLVCENRFGNMDKVMIIGELSLSGHIMPVNGVMPMVSMAVKKGYRYFIVPKENAKEAAIVDEAVVYGVDSLRETLEFLNKKSEIEPLQIDARAMYKEHRTAGDKEDFADIKGQIVPKRAAIIAAAGMHHILLIGSPGSGKSMIAKRMAGILPKPDFNECMEITKIQSIAGVLKNQPLVMERPFRAPHHTITEKALVGGGANPKPGEITLAHRGVLFLDELAEFKTDTLDALRQPLESGSIVISRTSGTYVFPADFMLVAATNPCKCGYYPDRTRCSCSELQVKNYLGRISGPMMNRIDICVYTSEVDINDLDKKTQEETSESIRLKVEQARKIQKNRYEGEEFKFNSALPAGAIEKYCQLSGDVRNILNKAYKCLGLSAREYYKVIRVARTIADLDASDEILIKHITEAIQFRTKEK